jgi:hypothetical protein
LRWTDVDLVNGVVHLHESIAQRGGRRWTKDIKTHQDRRIALSPETVDVLAEHFERWLERAVPLEIKLAPTAYVFSLAPDASTPLVPDSVSQRFSKWLTASASKRTSTRCATTAPRSSSPAAST